MRGHMKSRRPWFKERCAFDAIDWQRYIKMFSVIKDKSARNHSQTQDVRIDPELWEQQAINTKGTLHEQNTPRPLFSCLEEMFTAHSLNPNSKVLVSLAILYFSQFPIQIMSTSPWSSVEEVILHRTFWTSCMMHAHHKCLLVTSLSIGQLLCNLAAHWSIATPPSVFNSDLRQPCWVAQNNPSCLW